jgi:hypothetical protein
MLLAQPVFNLISNILPWDPQGWLMSYQLPNRTAPCKLVGDFISLYPRMSRDPICSKACQVEISFNAFWQCHTNGDTVSGLYISLTLQQILIKVPSCTGIQNSMTILHELLLLAKSYVLLKSMYSWCINHCFPIFPLQILNKCTMLDQEVIYNAKIHSDDPQ